MVNFFVPNEYFLEVCPILGLIQGFLSSCFLLSVLFKLNLVIEVMLLSAFPCWLLKLLDGACGIALAKVFCNLSGVEGGWEILHVWFEIGDWRVLNT